MFRVKWLLLTAPITFLFLVLTVAVVAQEEVPAPYAGQSNPFSWDDGAVISSGEEAYKKSCLGCHGLDGSNLSGSDFSDSEYSRQIKERPDYYFWIISEGALERGMPAYKSSLSEEERWQVITFLPSFTDTEKTPEDVENGEAETPEAPTPEPQELGGPVAEKENTLKLIAPAEIPSGRSLLLTAYLWDGDAEPLADTVVEFFVRTDFFANGEIEIGEAPTDDEGKAVIEYSPRLTGELEIVARQDSVESATTLSVVAAGEPQYQTEAGLHLPAPGPEMFIGPREALELGEMDRAPLSAFRLPGGIVSWLLILVAGVAVIWGTYFFVVYQVFAIPLRREIRDTDTRLVPLVGMAVILVAGLVLVTMLLVGPYSQFHLSG